MLQEEEKLKEKINQDIFSSRDLIYIYTNGYRSKITFDFIKTRDITEDYERMRNLKEKIDFASIILDLIRVERIPAYSLTISDIEVLKTLRSYDSDVLLISSKQALDNIDFIRYVVINSKNCIALFKSLPEKYFSNIRVMSDAVCSDLNFLIFINYLNYGDETDVRKYSHFLRLLNDKNNQRVLLNSFWLSYLRNNDYPKELDKHYNEEYLLSKEIEDTKLNEQYVRALKFYFSNDILNSQENFVLYGPQEKKIEESASYKLIKKYIKK